MDTRRFQIEDLERIFYLTRECGLNRNVTLQDWVSIVRWSVFDNPFNTLGEFGEILVDDGKPIGFIGYSFRPFRLDNTRTTACLVGDLSIHPNYRGGLGTEFFENTVRQFQDTVVFSTHFTSVAAHIWKKFGGREIDNTGNTFRGIISLESFMRSKLVGYSGLLSISTNVGLTKLAKYVLTKYGIREVEVSPTSEKLIYPFSFNKHNRSSIEGLCSKFLDTYDVGIYRTYKYLIWRYIRHPFRCRFHAFALEAPNGVLVGIGILKVDLNDIVYIYDIVYDPNVERIEEKMISSAVELSKKLGGTIMFSKYINRKIMCVLQNFGFTQTKKDYNQYVIISKPKQNGHTLFAYSDFKDY
tara:strand:- start:4938 stop:6005 length:1068 start_codon:yes stop_codon:yes gene_type:complete